MTKLSQILASYPEVDIAGGEALDQVADAAQTLGRKGTVTLKFTVEKQGARVVLDIGHEKREPKPHTELHLWHVGPDGLTQDDPYQTRLNTAAPGHHADPGAGDIIEPRHAREDQ